MVKNNLSLKEIVLVVVSAALGAFMSVFVYVLYLENKDILFNPTWPIMLVILVQSIKYLIIIGVILLFAFLLYKLMTLYFETANDSTSRLINWFLKKFKIEYINNIEILPDLGKTYQNNKELFNFIIFTGLLIWWVYKYLAIIEIMGGLYYLVAIITVYTAIDRLILYIKSKKS